jgi:hypothetical protein
LADRYAAIPKVDLTTGDPFSGGDRRRGRVRTASPELARSVLRIDEARKKMGRGEGTVAKTSQELVAVHESARWRPIEELCELSVAWKAAIARQPNSLETSARGLRASDLQLVDRCFSELPYALEESRHHRRW